MIKSTSISAVVIALFLLATPLLASAQTSAPTCTLTATVLANGLRISWTTTNNPTSGNLKRGTTVVVAAPAFPSGSVDITAQTIVPVRKANSIADGTFSMTVSNANGSNTCSLPTFSSGDGLAKPAPGTYPSPLTVTLSLCPADAIACFILEGAELHYTVNGTTPSCDSTLYTARITLTSSTDIKVVSCIVRGGEFIWESPVRTYSYTLTGGDTTAPAVALTAPANGATISGTVALRADASDNVGVSNVRFEVDGASIGTDSTSPYARQWDSTTAPNGAHTITAVARDAAGNEASDSRTVTVSNAGPAFEIGDRARTTARLSVRDSAGGVRLGTQKLGALGTIVAGPVAKGAYLWWQVDWDSGADGWSVQDYIEDAPFDTTTASVIATDAGAKEDGNSGAYRISRTGPATSALSVIVAFSGTATKDEDYALSLTVPLSARMAANEVSLTIPAGASFATINLVPEQDTQFEGTETAILSLVPSDDYTVSGGSATVHIEDDEELPSATPPTCTLTSPSRVAPGASFTLSWMTANVPTTARIRQGQTVVVGQPALPSGSKAITASSTVGTYGYTMTIGNAGGTNTCTRTIIVGPASATTPNVSITTPTQGAVVSGTSPIRAAVTTHGASVTNIQFLVDGTQIALDDAPPYSASWNTTTLGNGAHTVSAIALDEEGNSATASQTVIVSNAATMADPSQVAGAEAADTGLLARLLAFFSQLFGR